MTDRDRLKDLNDKQAIIESYGKALLAIQHLVGRDDIRIRNNDYERAAQEAVDAVKTFVEGKHAAHEQTEVQLAGCGVMANGCGPEFEVNPGDFGWSDSYETVRRIRRELEALRAMTAELHDLAAKYNPQPVDPERKAALQARVRAQNVDPVTAWNRLKKGLEPQAQFTRVEEIDALWFRWDAERNPHEKAKLQMELGASVALLLEHIQALQAVIDSSNGDLDK